MSGLNLTPVQLTVLAPDTKYLVSIGPGLLGTLPARLAAKGLDGGAVVVTNATLAPRYGEALARQLGAPLLTLPDGEQYKTLESVRMLYEGFASAKLERHGAVVALGGGVIGDTAGFAAATYLRGVALVQAPTSLLAMVDSSVGGKVGIDLPQGKNLVGAFKQPVCVVADVHTLHTLPDAEWRCGVAEIVKAGLIREPSLLDPALYVRGADENADRRIVELVRRAVAIKAAIVEEDPYEHAERAFLNLGHTFGHALEQVSGYTWKHGDAVAVGLMAAARLSLALGLCDTALPGQVEALLYAVGLPVRFKGYAAADIREAMETDKKRQASRLRFILLRAAGEPIIVSDAPDALVLEVIESLREA